MAGCCEHGNEPSRFTKCGEFLDGRGTISSSRQTCSIESSSYSKVRGQNLSSRFSTNFRGKFCDSTLTVQRSVVIKSTACCNVNNPCVLPTQYIYEVHRILTIKSYYFPKHLCFVIVPRCVPCEVWSEFVYLIYINFSLQSDKISSKASCETVPHGHSLTLCNPMLR